MIDNHSNVLIAHLSEVRSNGMDARIIEQHVTDLPILTLGNDEILAGAIGSYVVVHQADIKLLALVSKIWEKDHFNN